MADVGLLGVRGLLSGLLEEARVLLGGERGLRDLRPRTGLLVRDLLLPDIL